MIGSYTRSCRMVIDPNIPRGAKAAAGLFAAIRNKNPGFQSLF